MIPGQHQAGPRLRIVVADDEPVVRSGIREILSRDGGFDVVGDASSCDEVIVLAARLRPHVIVTEIRLQKEDAVEAIGELRRRYPDIRILAFSALMDERFVLPIVDTGVNGYLLKRARAAELVDTIRIIARGGTVIDPVIAGRILEIVRERHRAACSVSDQRRLSTRDRAILRLLAEGRSNREIALELHLAEQTVKNYVSEVLHRLGISKRVLVQTYLEHVPQLGSRSGSAIDSLSI